MARLKNLIEEVVKDEPIVEINENPVPLQTDPKWTEYVLSQLEEDELYNGSMPTTDGLRRVAEILLGPILESSSHIVQAPNPANEYTAAIEHSITFADAEVGHRTFCDVADCSSRNTNETFSKFSTSTAATKAEGRALRKALKLRHVFTAEENESYAPNVSSTFINDSQITFMNMMCERNNINVMEYINSGKNKYKVVEEIPYHLAGKMNNVLSAYQRGDKPIPPGIVGYQANWRVPKNA